MKQNTQQYYRPQNKQKKSYKQFHNKQESEWRPYKLNRPEQLWQHPNDIRSHIESRHEDSSVSPPNPNAPLDPKHKQRKEKKRLSILEWPKEFRM